MKLPSLAPARMAAYVLLALGSLAAGASSGAADSPARFGDYPATEMLNGAARNPDFSGRDKSHRSMRTRIREGVAAGMNFGGHYTLIEIGCGGSCRFAKVVDLRTGEVGNFPYGGEEQYQMMISYRPASRLVKARWKGDWDSPDCTEVDVIIEGMDWRVVREARAPQVNGYCDY
ncbi:hypothetical protein G5B38_19250 (plasmid) [Pseudohalocynthiibacter aestuariivivens]|nr:hypothetical protein [Pseudohalocynthiibacter aestuariivivens]QIE47760.1 hypothetical protein G5B38_19250 [Pseudohalocynthiibacter aestuariivivens]